MNTNLGYYQVFTMSENCDHVVYVVTTEAGFQGAVKHFHHAGETTKGQAPKVYPALVMLTYDGDVASDNYVECQVIDSPEFLYMYLYNQRVNPSPKAYTLEDVFNALALHTL
jgi:hypothetical protein